MKTITINNREYKLLYGFGAQRNYEALTKSWEGELSSNTEFLILAYACIFNAMRSRAASFEEYLVDIDEDPAKIVELSECVNAEISRFTQAVQATDESKKKV